MNPITGQSFNFKGVSYIITENWSSGKITYMNKGTKQLHYTTTENFKDNEKDIEIV